MDDYEIKDEILRNLLDVKSENHFWHDDSVANKFNISKQRALALLNSIYTDHRCRRQNGYGSVNFMFKPNKDTESFLQSGGYTKLARAEEEKENLSIQKLRGEVSELTDRLLDYKNVKRNAKWGLRVAIFVGCLELLKWIVELLKPSIEH